ncbi:MAG: tetratricopeptide repeat protein [Calditrichaeota bacterium]|nr:MAG: tetratricopeptide repeat protein [Calditrichota bacterium]
MMKGVKMDLLRRVIVFVSLVVAFHVVSLPAQVEEPELPAPEQEQAPCKPENLSVPYDTLAGQTTDLEKIKVWYDFGREYFKIARYEKKPRKYAKPIPYFWRVVLNDPTGTFKVAYSRLVESYMNMGALDSALIAAYRGLEKYPEYATLHYFAGEIFRRQNRIRCAIPHYEALVQSKIEDPKVLKNYWAVLAGMYFEIGDPRAIEAQQKVVALDPADAEASALLARIMERFGQDPLPALEEAFLKDTTNIENARAYGRAAFDTGEYQKALRAYRTIVNQNPEDMDAWMYLARSYEGLDKLQKAIHIYRQILTKQPTHLNALVSLASVYSRMHQFQKARSYIRKALKIDPNYGYAYLVMGQIYEDAVSYCSSRRKKKKGFTYDDKLVYELARAEYKKAARRDPSVATQAEKRYQDLAPFIRTKEDIHMHHRNTIKDPCYKWIQQ